MPFTLATVFPAPEAAGRSFLARHGSLVNHWSSSAQRSRAGKVCRLLGRFRAAGNPFPFGRAKLDPPIALAVRHVMEQGLLERPLSLDDVWAGLLSDKDAGEIFPPDLATSQ